MVAVRGETAGAPAAIALTGAATPLGTRVRRLLESGDGGEGAVAGAPRMRVVALDDLVAGEIKRQVEGVDAVVHLAVGQPVDPSAATGDVEAARRVLDAAGTASVGHLVVLSDATVYGAWSNNPVPLTEDAVLRPNAGFAFATERAEIERLVGEWRSAHPGSTAAVLRPARTPGHSDWLVRALRPSRAVPELAAEPPAQFLHLDDLATAVVLACRARLDGAFNVAPDQAIPGEDVRALTGAGPTLRLPDRVAHRVVRWRFQSGLGPTPPELLPYTLHPWVVANDRLRAAGWRPEVTNEEACVDAYEAGPWATLSPRRRQEIALGVAGVGLVGLAVGGALGLRRLLKR
jgi:UDP-glucose 4-epimerase